VLGGESYMAQNSLVESFGVGNATNVDYIKVNWLSGLTDILYNVNVNQKLTVIEGTALSASNYTENTAIIYYPNPVIHTLKLESEQRIEQVIVYSVLGKKELELLPEIGEYDIDFSKLASGYYFVKVISVEDIKIIKILKQ
ncbi:MAG: T9SS type A sorting domain-containing protein, partial [Winogradskyella sp.]